MTAEKTKKKNNDVIEELKKENKDLKRTRDELLQNKRVTFSGYILNRIGCHCWADIYSVENWRN
jgi:hypothetical protein